MNDLETLFLILYYEKLGKNVSTPK